jgi:hypothetical protein
MFQKHSLETGRALMEGTKIEKRKTFSLVTFNTERLEFPCVSLA